MRPRISLAAAVVAAGLVAGQALAETDKDAAPAPKDTSQSAAASAYAKAVPRDVPWDTPKPASGSKKPSQAKAHPGHDAARPPTLAEPGKTAQTTIPTSQQPVRPPPAATEPAKTTQSAVPAASEVSRPVAIAPASAKTPQPSMPSREAVRPVAETPGLAKTSQGAVPGPQAIAQPVPAVPEVAKPTQPTVPAVREAAKPEVAPSPPKTTQTEAPRRDPLRLAPAFGPVQAARPIAQTPREAMPPTVPPAVPSAASLRSSQIGRTEASAPHETPGPLIPRPPADTSTAPSTPPPAARQAAVGSPTKPEKPVAVAPSPAPKAAQIAPPAPRPAPREAATPVARALPPVTVITTQHSSWGRLSFVLHGNPTPAVRRLPEGLELTFAAGTKVQIPAKTHLREATAVDTAEQDGTTVARIRLACDCMPDEQTVDGILRLDFHTRAAPRKDVPATGAEAAELATLRETLTAKLAALNGTPVPKPPDAHSATAAARSPVIGVAVGTPPGRTGTDQPPTSQPQSGTSPPGTSPPGSSPSGPSPVCIPPVDTSGWRGADGFVSRLVGLRSQVAFSRGGAADMAALAEFYLAYGLGNEALAVAGDALDAGPGAEDRVRLARDADIARLLKGEQLAPDAALLALPANCPRSDAPLWRALAAASARDTDAASRDIDSVATQLHRLPEPLLRALAFRIVAGVGNNVEALQAMAGALRNTMKEIPEDEARRFLLQARIAALAGDREDYAAFLERASHHDLTVPGVIAKARLAAIRAGIDNGSAGVNEEILADAARTYRHEALGQQAAEQYAELKLRRHDYAAALEIADESAGPHGGPTTESRGASLAVRILRMLFVDPGTPALPDPTARIALFLRYGGYTTPGEKGDDIRLAAARLMLDQHMPRPALEALRQISDSAAATPEVMRLRAAAEASGGDPAKAMELVRGLPDGSVAHRIASDAKRRMNKPLEAAHLLDDATGVADRTRRASLLFDGEAWGEAAGAYAELLRDPSLPADTRDEAARRYALAVAMTGAAPVVSSPKLPDKFERLVAAVPPPSPPAKPTGATPDLKALRGAIERTKSIESLLDPAAAAKPGS